MDKKLLRTILRRDPYIKTKGRVRPDNIIDAVTRNYKSGSSENLETSLERIQQAIALSASAHEGVVRKSGEPYIVHPNTVAYFLAEMGMDSDCIIAGLLHDTVEDTTTTVIEISEMFGETVANLVDGVTKLTELKLGKEEKQAIAFKKLITFAKDDTRIILIKLFDRLHNMMTLDAMQPEKQVRIANETLRFYAPLAHRLGVYWLKEELEALSFYFAMKEEWDRIDDFIHSRFPNVEETINNLIEKVSDAIEAKSPELSNDIYEIYGRVKSYYSIYKKTIRKQLEPSSLHDILGVRVIVDEDNHDECYLAMAAIHSYPEFTIVNKYFKDYISRPKENGYMSIHTVVRHKEFFLEVQIRTKKMDKIAREGNASHWAYKNDVSSKDKVAKWLENVLGDLNDSENPIDFMNGIENALPLSSIAIFSPKGDIYPLPEGSTLLDFAYAVHGDLGDRCIGGSVNGKKVPIYYKLSSKDAVQIETSKNQTPRKDWLNFVKTAKARQYIRRFLKRKEKKINEQNGRNILKPLFVSQNRLREYEDIKNQQGFKKLADKYSIPKRNQENLFFSKLALGEIKLRRVINSFFSKEEIQKLIEAFPKRVGPLFAARKEKKSDKNLPGTKSIFIKSIGEIKDYRIANCCMPSEGDTVAAYISPTRGYILHKASCNFLKAADPERIENDVYWYEFSQYHIEFIIRLKNNKGALLEVVEELSAMDFNITSLHLNPEDAIEESGNVFVTVKGSDIRQINILKKNLKKSKSIIELKINNIDF